MSESQPRHDLRSVAAHFQIYGDFREAAPYGSGHINDTYAAVFNQSGSSMRYIFQRINHNVFKNPAGLMVNVERVTTHIRRKLEALGADQISRRVLTLVRANDGKCCYADAAGNHWRCYLFIEHATSYDRIETPRQAFEAARAFGQFQKHLADLPAPRLEDTIPDFHHSRRRFDALRQAIERDACNRAAGVKAEIGFALRHEPLVDVLLGLQARGQLPERVTHNDCKLNNVMLDDATGEGMCVIDLDTVMPGLALYDFGDMCRTAACPTLEDESDLSRVEMRMDMFEALVGGYLASAGQFLTPVEKDHLVFCAKLITFEIGFRFLEDHLRGDLYFKVHRPGQSADRARVQFKMVDSFERNEVAMRKVVEVAERQVGRQ
ncbi:MAG TPA: aminoglycoside phosphotransferase family protein [Candidatus Paceibacterota bacterium]|nr:aminoglycoside phosphotransferase family protein [Verrucomicrobiota bacterium]HSA11247.1 aminoglycoside phosphotransferase family protein [Candidatus Paceibacterota bacterium]